MTLFATQRTLYLFGLDDSIGVHVGSSLTCLVGGGVGWVANDVGLDVFRR